MHYCNFQHLQTGAISQRASSSDQKHKENIKLLDKMPNDRRRQRYRSKKHEQDKQPTNGHYMLAKRPEEQRQPLVQPKILLKTRNTTNGEIITRQQEDAPIKTIIIQRSTTDNLAKSSSSNNLNKNLNGIVTPSSSSTVTGIHTSTDPYDETLQEQQQTQQQQDEPVIRKMVRPVTLISGSGVLNFNSRKVLNKNNSDFLVVGVLGEAGVGKTTIMNLLARNEKPEGVDNDLYKSVFCMSGEKRQKSENAFNTKLKNPTRARTESFLMFITGERMILIDSPPILNTQRRHVTPHNEVSDLKNIVNLMNICHILIFVYEGSLNLEVLRLIRLALQTKPDKLSKSHTRYYQPSFMFIKNRTKRLEYTSTKIDRTHSMLRAIFDVNNLNIYTGTPSSSAAKAAAATASSTAIAIYQKNKDDQQEQTQKKSEDKGKDQAKDVQAVSTKKMEPEEKKLEPINYLMLPEFYSSNPTTYHPSLKELTMQLRERLLATSHNKINEGNLPFNETDWFETVVKSIQEGLQKFEEPYVECYLKYKGLREKITSIKTHAETIASFCYEDNESSNSSKANASNSRLSPHKHNHIDPLKDFCIGNKVRDRARDRKGARLASKT